MPTIKGIISFPTLFTPKVAKGATEPKFTCSVLLPPNDPQLVGLKAEVEAAKQNTFPSGYTGADECLKLYDAKYKSKDYYDPRFSGWWVLSSSAKAEDKPHVVNENREPVTNPGDIYGGLVVWMNMAISGYIKGKGGIGGWLNGVMSTGEVGEQGRLDNKPSVEQMFANVGAPNTPSLPGPPGPGAPAPAPSLLASPGPGAPAPEPQYVMTDKAAGNTRQQLLDNGWTDELLIAQGMMMAPIGVTPSFS